MFNLNTLNNIKNPELIKDEIIKLKIEDNYKEQLTDYIILQKKVNYIKNLLLHKPRLSALDYTKLNTLYNFSKSIIMSKKSKKNDDLDYSIYKSTDKKRMNNNFGKKFYLSNPILKKIFLSKDEDIKLSLLNTESSISNKRNQSASQRDENLNHKNINFIFKSNYIYTRPKDDLYKLPKQIKNKYHHYNLTDLKNNTIKRNYQLKETMSKFDKYAKNFMRGLSLSEEQNALYQKCKHTDLSLDEDKKKKTKYVKMNLLSNKIDKRFSDVVINKKRLNLEKKEKNINGALFKYSLKNLLKAENPIKILL